MNAAKLITVFAIFLGIGCQSKSVEIPNSDTDNGGLILPDGFGAIVVIDSVGGCRHIAVNDNGDIYAKLKLITGDKGNVALRDTNNDGKADIIMRFGNYPNDGNFATEMRIHNGYLYFSSELRVYRQKLTPPDLVPKSKTEVIMIDRYPIRWHNAKSLAFDGKGGLYVTFSAPTNVCEDWSTVPENTVVNVRGEYPCSQLVEFGGIWRFDENKQNQYQSDGIRYATGLRSVVGLAWNRDDNKLYALQHGRDYLYGHAPQYYTPWQNAVLPAEEFVDIEKDDDFGWPYTYYDPIKNQKILAPEYGGDGLKQATGYKNPLMGLPAHWAPNDMLFYKGDQFPERYKNGAFVAFHGSTNRNPYPQAGYIVAFIPFENGKPTGKYEVFADGFTVRDTLYEMADATYRPCGLAEGPDGSLYISESKVGKIWRIAFHGDKHSFGEKELHAMDQKCGSKTYIKTPSENADVLRANKIVNAAKLYESHCSGCHNVQGQGFEGVFPPLAGSEWVNGDHEKMIRVLLHGQKGEITVKGKPYNQIMPAFGFLNDQEIAAVATYIKSEFGNKGGKIPPETVAKYRNK